jgi:fructokinase
MTKPAKIFAIGETVLDIIFKNGKPAAARPGGSSLNASISLGRMKVPVDFISEFGTDEAGMMIDSFLKDNHVSTQYVNHYADGKTHIALAFLDESSNAQFSFYKDYPSNRLTQNMPDVCENDIILYGSLFSIVEEIRIPFVNFLKEAKEKKAILIYDPNFRKPHLADLPKLKPMILENILLSTIIRGSDEDFEMIFGTTDADETFKAIGDFCKYLIYTENENGVCLRTPKLKARFPAKKITPISTIGAGDNFNAGLIYSLYKNKVELDQLLLLNEDAWRNFVSTGIDFATDVCLSYDNYISEKFISSYLSE